MWICYKAYLEAKAPIHIGYGAKLGIVDRTRYYIPAKNIWGALTNLITRSVIENYDPRLYEEIGKSINENIKFSYFYPIKYDKENGKIKVQQVLAPCYGETGLRFGNCKNEKAISLEEFERIFISSFVSTAIDKTSKSAEEGSLHEVEFVKDKIKIGKVMPTIFMGYIFIKEDETLKIKLRKREVEISFTDSIEVNGVRLEEIWIGGERNYGFGRVKILLEKFNHEEIDLFNSGMIAITSGEDVLIRSEGDIGIALSHIKVKEGIKFIRGDIEPLIGREWSEKGSGQRVSAAKICIAPGSQFICNTKIVIGNYGIWK